MGMLMVLRTKKFKTVVPIELKSFETSRPVDEKTGLPGPCKTAILDPATGTGVSIEVPSIRQRRLTAAGHPTSSISFDTNNGVVAFARLVRTMGDHNVQRAVERPSCEGITSDADIIFHLIQSKLAAARWSKANNVLGGLRKLNLLAGGGRLDKLKQAASSPAFEEPPRTKRMSIEAVKHHIEEPDPVPEVKANIPLTLPQCTSICRCLHGAWAFAYVDSLRKWSLAARSADGFAELFWYQDEKHGLIFVNSSDLIPQELRDPLTEGACWGEVPPGHFFLGTSTDNPADSFLLWDEGGDDVQIILDGRKSKVENECRRRISMSQLDEPLRERSHRLSMVDTGFSNAHKLDTIFDSKFSTTNK